MPGFWRTASESLLAGTALAALTFFAFRLHATTATAALYFFFFIVLVSLWSTFATSLFSCILAILCFDYFFAPPIFNLKVRDPRDIVLLAAFSSVSLIISRLVSRVRDRTAELIQSNEQLRAEMGERRRAEEAYYKAHSELAHVGRVTAMGELTASLAHEINQPITGIVTNGNACVRWLAADPPNLDEAREAARRIVRDGKRAGDMVARIRALATKTAPIKIQLDMNQTIQEVVALARDEMRTNDVILRMELANDLSAVLGDRVQLQQVLLNLIMNGVEAMSTFRDRQRELVIRTQNDKAGQVQVTVQDSGIGLDTQSMEKIFEAFYTTKQGGMGMGLSISRSIVQNHGGRLWAVANEGPGATFQFTVPEYP